MFKKNRKTTIAGILAAIGLGFSNHANPFVKIAAEALSALAIVLMGASARDTD